MSDALKSNGHANGNGHGHANGTSEIFSQFIIKAEPAVPVVTTAGGESQVVFQMASGGKLRGTPLRITRHTAVFELYDPGVAPQLSETLADFKIILQELTSYSGSAVVRQVLNAGVKTVCEVTLEEGSWREAAAASDERAPGRRHDEFKCFLNEWQKAYQVTPDYKVVVADLQMFLTDLRLWLDQVELSIRAKPAADRARLEAGIAAELRPPVIAVLNNLFERFETVSGSLAAERRPAHHAFGRRQLHPLFLCAPFFHRTFTKPLGYAGDFEMMSMIVRNGMEGSSLFAKLVNAYLLDQPPCRAVRNRVGFLNTKIIQEVGRVARRGQTAKVFAIACGPAWEAVNFIADHPLADRAEFHLLDFNEETLRQTTARVTKAQQQQQRKTRVTYVKNSVQNLLRAGGKKSSAPEYDLIYCSGLYDYLSDKVCLALNTHLYDLLKPGGLLVVGNFAPWTPGQNLMEHLMDWFLIYRDVSQLAALAPAQAAREDCAVRAEHAGANIFLEARKPE